MPHPAIFISLVAVFGFMGRSLADEHSEKREAFIERTICGVATAFAYLFIAGGVGSDWSPGFYIVTLIFAVLFGFLYYFDSQHQKTQAKRYARICARFGLTAPSWRDVPKKKFALDRQLKQLTREEDERNYIRWCDESTDEERILQRLCDGLLEIHNWDGMPRIKVRLENLAEHKGAHYKGSFYSRQRPVFAALNDSSYQLIEFNRKYWPRSIESMTSTMKHEMCHAWIDWRGIKVSDPHGEEFQRKLQEVQ